MEQLVLDGFAVQVLAPEDVPERIAQTVPERYELAQSEGERQAQVWKALERRARGRRESERRALER
jgi:hypothetical protein